MQRHIMRRWLVASITLALVVTLVVTGTLLLSQHAEQTAEAQGNQPANTQELFEPFWEAWDLLHDNYVDPLDDDVLVEGALEGMLRATDISGIEDELVVPDLIESPANNTERFTPFWETWTLLHDTYGDELDDTALMEGAIRGLIASIDDPHMDYMDPDTFSRVFEGLSGEEYEGIGAVVSQNDETGGLELISIFEGSPAEAAGLKPGDQIITVEGEDITDLTQEEIIALVRGPADSLVRLGILRSGEVDLLKFEVRRGRITVPSVSSELLDNNIGYVRLSQFEFNTTADMRLALQELDVENLDGLILDLRGNPGGFLSTTIEVASAFIPDGVVVIERTPDNETDHQALGNAIAVDVPMVVLVDQGSASASEIIAGTMQDRERAIVVGMPTFGKGSVQTWRQLSNGGGIRITISRWYTPNGDSVTDVGVTPDYIVPYDPEVVVNDRDNQLNAAIEILLGTYEPDVEITLEDLEEDAAPAE